MTTPIGMCHAPIHNTTCWRGRHAQVVLKELADNMLGCTGMETIPEAANGEATSGEDDAAASAEPSADAAASALRHGLAAVKLEDGETSGLGCTVSGVEDRDNESDSALMATDAARAATSEAIPAAQSDARSSGDGAVMFGADGASVGEEPLREMSEQASLPARSRRSSRAAVSIGMRSESRCARTASDPVALPVTLLSWVPVSAAS